MIDVRGLNLNLPFQTESLLKRVSWSSCNIRSDLAGSSVVHSCMFADHLRLANSLRYNEAG